MANSVGVATRTRRGSYRRVWRVERAARPERPPFRARIRTTCPTPDSKVRKEFRTDLGLSTRGRPEPLYILWGGSPVLAVKDTPLPEEAGVPYNARLYHLMTVRPI